MLAELPQTAHYIFDRCAGLLSTLIPALREVHEHGFAHLQPHLSNWYDYETKAGLADWETMVPVAQDKDGILNRTLDFAITVRVITQFIQSLLIMPDNNYQLTAKAFLLKAAYCYDNKREASHILDSQGKATEDINHLAKWMKEVVRSSQGEDSISNRNQFTIR